MKLKKSMIIVMGSLLCFFVSACDKAKNDDETTPPEETNLATRSLTRAMEITDNALEAYFTGSGMTMARYYNPYSETRSNEIGSVWMYTSAIEAVTAILRALEAEKEQGDATRYDAHFNRYEQELMKLYDGADYYLGTFTLTSYTGTNEWTVYGVNRGNSKGGAQVEGIENVYDDQMWLIREFLEAYKVTGNELFLEKAEYLTAYVLDGWDCTIDENGNEVGGISWGPGYVTKHACSNGPMISPLVWLHELYKGKTDEIAHRYIDETDRRTRKSVQVKKSDYYLLFAKKIYEWQKNYLLRGDGVYDDMMGGCTPGSPQLEQIGGVSYRRGITCRDRVGPAITYNSGTMLSGAADLYRVTGDDRYLVDGTALANASFSYFAKKGVNVADHYTFDISGFRNWFNGVLMRGYVDFYPLHKDTDSYIDAFQKNLDYAYEHFFYKGFLPTNLLVGWNRDRGKNNTEGMFTFAFAAEYAVLSRYEQTK
ncbi:glycosyl hydrolase family 76 [Sphingobacterium allocomposti]|uniref:Glycosyl hydrolase family 76 n=1 Tax=Sphingobacterium allocomposti TaxID=415956 RepID=A0A5S5DJF9_9SPHI|nr:glycoside hydrolase family 76 protein [Sphingobacterium composti Yoo et al. 2007 non Ten et al. 2007]TYP96037.1 glycosyl hydrolase family 76 [Sphingobacterium composti Yoo et al. 2007 non Ten et al. 2007]